MPELIVDLHIHSHYSRATSSQMNIEDLYLWAKIKGINVMGTGDFTHPAWIAELQQKLEPAEGGLYKLKNQYAQAQDAKLPESIKHNLVRFVLTVEISTIYSKGGRVRKLHNIIIVPDFTVESEFNLALSKIGNLKADGRPILGMDSKTLLKMTLDSHPDSLFIPAHIWTPHFAMFGSNSGFDSIVEAFEDLSDKIVAVETGLSSDPFMNWRINELKDVTLVSNSDAHSAPKLGREANIINAQLTYLIFLVQSELMTTVLSEQLNFFLKRANIILMAIEIAMFHSPLLSPKNIINSVLNAKNLLQSEYSIGYPI